MALLLKGAHVIDPAVGLDDVCDIVVRDGVIVEVGHDLSIPKGITRELAGKIVIPGLVDMHTHLREPGYEYKETIESGTRAAARGGFTGVCPMPNTDPVCDTGSCVRFIVERAAERGKARVYPIGAISVGLKGETLAEIGDMVSEGAVAFSDDGRGVQDAGMMRRAMDYTKMFGKTIISHCEVEDLVGGGVVNEGVVSTRLGMAGWPAAGEEIQIARDIALAELTGCHLHIAHITTAGGVELIREAKAKGIAVTCEVMPHHLFLNEDDLTAHYDTAFKMNPPLRTKADCEALIEGLLDGTVDAIATDHAPHAPHEKALEFEVAPFGTTGLETALPLVLTNLVSTGRMSYDRLIEVMAHNPRAILGLAPVHIEAGTIADLTVIDPNDSFTVNIDDFESKSVNSAFIGTKLIGRAFDVYVGGYASLESGKVVD